MLIIACILVGLIILLGWERLIEPFSAAFALPLAMLITVLAGLVARHIGVRWHRETVDARTDGRDPGYRWLLSYPAFFLISALGVINVAFYYLEGPTVLKQNIDEAEQGFSVLNSTAQIELRNVAHEEKVDRVRQLVTALMQEIENPSGICGVGSAARKTIGDIQALLPAFREFRGGGRRHGRRAPVRDCHSDGLVALANAYRNEAEEDLANDPDFARAGGPQREVFLGRVKSDAGNASDRFKAARDALDASAFTQRNAAYAVARSALESAAAAYSDDRQSLDQLTGRVHPTLRMTLDLAPTHDLGSFTTILHSLLRRAGVFTTWVYILIAIAMDFAVIALMKSAHAEFARSAPRRGAQHSEVGVVSSGPAISPRFLWVNPD